ncbi:MAG: hypothetical protein ACK4V1_03815 [Burkholderiaceae bacterium]
MPEPLPKHPADAVEQAIDRVLRAEQQAGRQIADCTAQAQRRVQVAHSRARAIAERAGRRTDEVRRIAAARLAQQLDAIERERQALLRDADHDPTALQRLQSAIDRLAAALTSEDRGAGA